MQLLGLMDAVLYLHILRFIYMHVAPHNYRVKVAKVNELPA